MVDDKEYISRRVFLKSAGMFGLGLGFPSLLYAGNREERMKDIHFRVKESFPESKEYLIVGGISQMLYFIEEGKYLPFVKSYSVSTSKYGFGNDRKSNKTPTGLHKIFLKIGDDAEIGAIFKKWRRTGRISRIIKSKERGPENMTTRVMPLVGCEEKNKYTSLRGIHIHGTSEEGLIGTPQSHGCIRMRNNDIVQLYPLVKVGTPVYISRDL